MQKVVGLLLLGIAVNVAVMASSGPPHWQGPEIDPASGSSALALLAGALVLIHGRRKRQLPRS